MLTHALIAIEFCIPTCAFVGYSGRFYTKPQVDYRKVRLSLTRAKPPVAAVKRSSAQITYTVVSLIRTSTHDVIYSKG